MYALLAIDTLLRITAALLFLFVAVPALARKRPQELDRMEWFWWCLAAGVTLLTLLGQVLTILNIFSAISLLVAIAALILVTRAKRSGRSITSLVRDANRTVVLASLNILEGRVNVRRRIRRWWRDASRRWRASLGWEVAAWFALIVGAATFRLVRAFSTANLGFSDTYAHLYLFRLLEQGRQVDPNWGPYPRGMHFLLLAIHELTNVDAILLMNFFGAFAGVLMTLAVADAARRLSGRLTAGLVAGAIFATMIGTASQYFLLGGSMATTNEAEARRFIALAPEEIPPTDAEYDVLLTVFQRQTATLPQELAIVFLFPAVMFLFSVAAAAPAAGGRDGRRHTWHWSGYLFCTAAIAAVHSGVVIPLILLSGVTVLATRMRWTDIRRALLTGLGGILLGSTWMLAFIAYPRLAAAGDTARASGVAGTAMYYFPFFRQGADARIVTWVAITPFVITCAAIAIALLLRRRTGLTWAALAALVFLAIHVSSRFGLPEIVEVRRNASWLAMTLAILIGIALAEFARIRYAKIAVAAVLAAWLWRVPLAGANDRLINYSGYNTTAYAVLRIQRNLEPFTWTLVTYGQEFPMVLGKGFHVPAAEFLDRYDPAQPRLAIPTKWVFIVVEKNPHRFQINTWAAHFSRADLERRLQTWCFLYQLTHRDIRVWLDDENVRVYAIERSDAEVQRVARGAS